MCLRVALTLVPHPVGTVPMLLPLPYPTPRLPRLQRRRHALSHTVSGESQLQIAAYAARKSTAQKMQYGAAPSADRMYIANAFEIGGRIALTRLGRGGKIGMKGMKTGTNRSRAYSAVGNGSGNGRTELLYALSGTGRRSWAYPF